MIENSKTSAVLREMQPLCLSSLLPRLLTGMMVAVPEGDDDEEGSRNIMMRRLSI